MNLNELRNEAYSIAKANGWHEQEHNDEHCLMLIITEIAEAVQADRKDKHADVAKFKEWQGNSLPLSEETRIRRFKEDFESYIKNSVEDELADVVIRCLDLAGVRGWDLQHVLDNVQEMNQFEEDHVEQTFAETAFQICELIIMATNHECAVHVIIESVIEYCKEKGIEIGWFIEQKMKYNQFRSYKHGGKKY